MRAGNLADVATDATGSYRLSGLTAGQIHLQILSGGKGPFLAKCMRWLVEWGDAMGAPRLVPVTNTQSQCRNGQSGLS